MNHSIRNWLYPIIIVAAAIFVAWSVAHYKTNTHSYEECANASQIATLNDLELNTAIDPEYKPTEAEKNQRDISNQIDCSDLSAQWAMSEIAMMGYIAGLLGLVFLGITVYETKSAADLTRQALDETKRNSKRGLRAYISCIARVKNCYGQDAIVFNFRFHNYGQTPAIQFGSVAIMKVDDKVIDAGNPDLKKLTIQPNSKVAYDFTVDCNEFLGGETITISIKVKYSDIFGAKRFINETKCIEVKNIPCQPAQIPIDEDRDESADNLRPNPKFVEDFPMFSIAFEDDLEQEAQEYAQANKS